VEGARSFQIADSSTPTECDHGSSGPPLKTILFDSESKTKARRGCSKKGGMNPQYEVKVVEALRHVAHMLPSLSFHNRVAIIVPDRNFATELAAALDAKQRSEPLVDGHGTLQFVTAAEASRIVPTCGGGFEGGPDAQEIVVLDSVDSFDGLERLVAMPFT
jgi:hypothetical protein